MLCPTIQSHTPAPRRREGMIAISSIPSDTLRLITWSNSAIKSGMPTQGAGAAGACGHHAYQLAGLMYTAQVRQGSRHMSAGLQERTWAA